MDTRIVIVGGGLAGMALAHHFSQRAQDFVLLEAEDRLGGRILSEEISGASFDLGPAWFWPGQPRLAELIKRLDLRYFDQYSKGDRVFQDQTGAIRRSFGYGSMEGALRIVGGIGALVSGLADLVPSARLKTGAVVTALNQLASGVEVVYQRAGDVRHLSAERVVLAVPPRISAATIRFTPELPVAARSAMARIPTWMAGQAKIVAVYEQPHWRDAGLSGDGTSQKGPMVEVHDASPIEGGPCALFGFVGYPARARVQIGDGLIRLARKQLEEMYGPGMANPLSMRLKDWAQVPTIATRDDHASPRFHPNYGRPSSLQDLWSGKLILSSSEMGTRFGGYLEGALEAAERTACELETHQVSALRPETRSGKTNVDSRGRPVSTSSDGAAEHDGQSEVQTQRADEHDCCEQDSKG